MTNCLNNLLSKTRKQSFGSPARCTLFLATCAILVLFFSACSTEPSPRRLAQQRDRADSIVGCVKGEQSLDSLVKEAEKSGDLTSSLKKHTFYNLLINNILYLCVT